jgi:WD40 repeat protein/serine/threonine protein kinase
MASDADRDLLFGLIALQNGLIGQGQLVAAFRAWTRDRSASLAEHLAGQGGLDDSQREAVEAMVALHLKRHDDSPERGLAAVLSGSFTGGDLSWGGELTLSDTLSELGLAGLVDDADRPPATDAGRRRFSILRHHARGGLGVVYVARDAELNREVALKQILDRYADDPASRRRFLLEAEVTGGLEHPGIVPVYSLGTDADGRPYYAMRLLQGETLRAAIDRFHSESSGDPDPGRRSLGLRKLLGRFLDVCNTIEYAHSRGVLHRDIKPGNVIVGEHGETIVIDWGLAKPLWRADASSLDEAPSSGAFSSGGSSETMPGSALGTPSYMSPEQADGDSSRLGPRSDVYGLGATLFYLLTGKAPHKGGDLREVLQAAREGGFPTPRRLTPSLDRALEAICLKAMAREPEGRYTSAQALADDVERWLADEPVSALPESPGRRLARWGRRNRALIRSGAAALVVLTLVSASAALMINAARWREHVQFLEASRQKTLAESLSEDLMRDSARVLLDDGLALCRAGDVDKGLIQMARGLAKAPEGSEVARLIRLNVAGWSRSLFPLRAHLAHADRVRAAISPDGTRIATASDDGTARIWDADGRPLTPPMRHEGEVNWVAFSPDGRRIVTASDDGTARVWEVADGRLLFAIPHAEEGGVNLAAFSPDGAVVATGGTDGTARIWDAADGRPLAPPMRHDQTVTFLAFSPDSSRLATASEDHTARVWDARTGEPRTPPLAHGGEVRFVTFNSPGSLIATAADDATARLWDAADGTPLGTGLPHRAKVNAVAFNPDGSRLLTACEDGTAQLWDIVSRRPLPPRLVHRGGILSVRFSADGGRIATASQDGTARIWDSETGQPLGPAVRHGDWVYSAAFSPDGARLLTASRDFSARIWDIAPAFAGTPMRGELAHFQHAAFAPDGTRVAAAGFDGKVRVWDARSGRLLVELDGGGAPTRSVAFSPDGRRIMAAQGPRAWIWDLDTRRESGPPIIHPGPITRATFSPDGSRLATAGMDGTACIWDLATGERMLTLEHAKEVLAVNFDPRGERIVTASADRTARVWDAATGRQIGRPLEHASEVWTAAFGPDGSKIVTGGQEDVVRIWDAEGRRTTRRIAGPAGFVNRARFSPDGATVLTAGSSAQIWDAASGLPLFPPLPFRGDVSSAAFSADGRLVVVSGRDPVVRVHDLPRPVPGGPHRVAAWIQCLTGVGFADDVAVALDGPGWQAACRRLAELGGPPG